MAIHVQGDRLVLEQYRGGIALVGPGLDDVVRTLGITDLPDSPLHITLLSASEHKAIGKKDITDITIPLDRIYVLGQADKKDVRFLVVLWNHADIWRKAHGLENKEYHVTLSLKDDHELVKGVGSLRSSMSHREILDMAVSLGEEGMDHTILGCWGDLMLVSIHGCPPYRP
jgi:atypical dual specificity phosphatase